MEATTKKGIILLADGVEEMEAVITLDVLRRASLQLTSASVGTAGLLVRGAHGIGLAADIKIEDAMDQLFDFVVLPGGEPGTSHLEQSNLVKKLIQRHFHEGVWVAAICAAPRILDGMGLLNGKRATSYPDHEIREKMVSCNYVDSVKEPVVVDGNIVTSRGPGTAFAFALKLVELLCGEDQVGDLKRKLLLI